MASVGTMWAPIDDETGKLQTHTASGDSLTKKSKNNSTVDSDMFLSLLVAEMQNQDPLEPTSNTEWVSQYATFTQVEKMTEMSESIDLLRANDLIGKNVTTKVTSEATGEVSYGQGIVDYVMVENGKPILIIGEQKYSISDIDSVLSDEYNKAYDMYRQFIGMIDALPDVKYGDKTYQNVIQGAYDYYNTMDDYQKNFMNTYASKQMATLAEWKHKMTQWGVTIKDTPEEEKTTSLDDILESFNTKMNAIMDKIKVLTDAVDKNTEASTNTGTGTNTGANGTTGTNNSGNTSTNGATGTDNSGNTSTNGTTGTDNSGSTSTNGTTGTDSSGNTSTNGTTGTDNSGSTGTDTGTTGTDNSGSTGTDVGTTGTDTSGSTGAGITES